MILYFDSWSIGRKYGVCIARRVKKLSLTLEAVWSITQPNSEGPVNSGFPRFSAGNIDRFISCGLSRNELNSDPGERGTGNVEFISHRWHDAISSIIPIRTNIYEAQSPMSGSI